MSSDEKKKSCILGKKLNSRQTFEKYHLQQKPNRRVAAEVETQEVLKLPCSRLCNIIWRADCHFPVGFYLLDSDRGNSLGYTQSTMPVEF